MAPDWVLAYMPDRDQVFKEFYKQVGSKPFAPEFIDSLIAVMRATEGTCWTEQVWAWQRWRSWANSSKYAVSDWIAEKAWYLDQLDCCLDLWWFQQGRDVKWIESQSRQVREEYRKDFRKPAKECQYPELVNLKYPVNKAFASLRSRGNVDFEGHKIYSLVSPPKDSPRKKVAENRNFLCNGDFLTWWKVAENRNFLEFQEAQKRYLDAKKVAQNAYRQWRETTTSEAPILIEKIIDNTSSSSVVSVLEEATTTILPDIPPEEHTPPPPNSTGLDLGGGEDGGAPQEVVVDALEEELPDLLAAHGKGALTKKQFSEVRDEISKLPEPELETAVFVRDYLPTRISKIQHAGAMPTLAQEFRRIRLRQLEQAKSVAPVAASRAAPPQDQVEYARSVLDDPSSTDNDRSMAMEILGAAFK